MSPFFFLFLGLQLTLALRKAPQFEEASLLQVMGLDKVPSPRMAQPVPSILMKIFQERQKAAAIGHYQKLCYVKELGVPGNLIRLFQDQGALFHPKEVTQALPCTQKFLFFNLSVIAQDEQLMMAQLDVRLRTNAYNSPYQNLELMVSIVQGPALQSDQKLIFRFLPWSQRVLHVDLLDVVKEWNFSPQSNLGLVLELLPRGNKVTIQPQDTCDNWRQSIQASLLVVTLTPQECPHFSHFARKRRAIYSTRESTSTHLCRRHQMVVKFEDLGWHKWIIAPKEFRTSYCQGDCPFSLMNIFNSSNYAFLQTIMNSKAPKIPKAACIPTKLSPISMLYYDNDGNIVLQHLEGMVVDECGCG
ncbi:growth/differentiation factor 3 [Monodelphis domestica]|uniref:Growth/differentiation factor 3 n=1 Tax=Monodelphis domestica TaxID=13616 RepID=F7AL60_MONDO|nr:growth/differentiation factor 3 [Monodelphis domestica]